jgi:hypothetical protein
MPASRELARKGRYLPAHRLACHQAFARKGGKSLIDRAEVTAARKFARSSMANDSRWSG